MARDAAAVKKLKALLAQLKSMTMGGGLRWERQVSSAHRYARWNNNLLILGPSAPLSDQNIPRYLFITPFDSPDCIEINSSDEELGHDLMSLVRAVEDASADEMPTDPFAITDELLDRLSK